MFKDCNAYTIASESEWQGRLLGIMNQVGFRYSIRLEAAGRLDSANTSALNFLVVHSSKSRDLILKVTKAVRASHNDKIRFMPIVVLLDASLESAVHKFINLGCDDIIIYPCPAKMLAQRLSLQFKTEREYFETDSYFGPDRRLAKFDKGHSDRRDGKDFAYKKYVIKRELTGRINIISKTMHQPEAEMVAV